MQGICIEPRGTLVPRSPGKGKGGRPRKEAPEGSAARKLADWLDAQGKSREWLAEQTGLAYSTVNQLCTGARRPGLKVALKIAEITQGAIPAEAWI